MRSGIQTKNKIILYQDDDEITRVSVRFADEDLWLTQSQLAEIYGTTKQNISQHIDNILNDGELDANRTVKDSLTVRQEGKRQVQRSVLHYNLDMVIALGYRVQSQVATRFRRWATQRLHEYIRKGFAMDDERLKQGGNRYFRELPSASGIFAAASGTFLISKPLRRPKRSLKSTANVKWNCLKAILIG